MKRKQAIDPLPGRILAVLGTHPLSCVGLAAALRRAHYGESFDSSEVWRAAMGLVDAGRAMTDRPRTFFWKV